jgi:DNA-directed RNA polymerase specialized sigma24 family protein
VRRDITLELSQTGSRIESPEAWLVATTSRLAIDRLRRLKTEREA